jgi:phage terminase large subunit
LIHEPWGRSGATGTRVLPQFEIADKMPNFYANVRKCDYAHHYFGFDFGFEESYNAVVSMCIDPKKGFCMSMMKFT